MMVDNGKLNPLVPLNTQSSITFILTQLQKFVVAEEDLAANKQAKRFLGGLIATASALGSLFSIGLSTANNFSLKTLQRHVNELDDEIPGIQQKPLLQQRLLNPNLRSFRAP